MLAEKQDKKYYQKKKSVLYKGKLIDLSEPVVMGILNITPDSFYDGGRFNSVDTAIQQAAKMLDEGATIIDIGAFSTRPGAKEIDEKEELNRLMPVVAEVRASFPDAIISIDTFRSAIAEKVVETMTESAYV